MTPENIIEQGSGLAIYIGFCGANIASPDTSVQIKWNYQAEPSFGDSWNHVSVNGVNLPGIMWGRGHCWSPCLQYFTFERYSNHVSELIVYSRQLQAMYIIAENSAAELFNFPVIKYRAYSDTETPLLEFIFSGEEEWESINKKSDHR